jgi:hypothetical protein
VARRIRFVVMAVSVPNVTTIRFRDGARQIDRRACLAERRDSGRSVERFDDAEANGVGRSAMKSCDRGRRRCSRRAPSRTRRERRATSAHDHRVVDQHRLRTRSSSSG